MESNGWRECKLINVVQFNPKESIKKGDMAKKISMDKLESYTRKITGFEIAKFKGGTKFRNGDTLLARITPCLENGKTAQVGILNKNEVAFGSTEFIVLREKLGITDNDFIYYMSISPEFRNLAIRSMNGSSGRQRVQKDVLEECEIKLPLLKEQKAIAHILSTLDEKIEVNNQMNKTLEKMAQLIFKHWFVDFEFPNEEGKPYKSSGGKMIESELGMIPEGWRVGTFGEYIDTVLGGDWGKKNPQGNYIKKVYCLRGADIPEVKKGKKGNIPKRYILEKNYKNKKLSDRDLVVEISGGSPTQSTGRITYITNFMLSRYTEDFVCTNFCRAITLKDKNFMEFFYSYWTRLYDLNVFFQYENGTTGIKNFDINTFLDKFLIIKPSKKVVYKFHYIIEKFINIIQNNGNENIKLTEIKDSLLPKLMSGEIRVPLDN